MRVLFINRIWLMVIWILMGVLLLALFLLKYREDRLLEVFSFPITGKTIIIDAGHGGIDPGAVSPSGTREDRINLCIAKKLRSYLEHDGANVVMTRETDEGIRLNKRAEMVREYEPDIVVSIHLNKFGQSQYYGAQTFYMKGSEEGKALAKSIQDELIRVLDRGNKRQIKASDSFLILKASDAPSVIVECGFLSNPEEEKLLKTDEYQERIAWAIYTGIVGYFSSPINE